MEINQDFETVLHKGMKQSLAALFISEEKKKLWLRLNNFLTFSGWRGD
jgi:hypothetical protein